MNKNLRRLRRKKQPSPSNLDTTFLQWLHDALRNETGRQLVREQLRRHELPVIQLDAADSD